MRKKLLLFIFFFYFFTATSYAAEGLTITGYDWQEWPTASKLSFVEGWVKCGMEARRSLPLNIKKWDEAIESVNLTEEYFKEAGVLFNGITIGQIVDTISSIYSDPRVTTMDITEVMSFVSGRLMQGWTMKDLD